MTNYEDIEEAILCHVAGKIVETLPDEEKKKILEASLTKTLSETFRPWNIEKIIQKDAEIYMAEYIKRPDVQERIKIATQNAVNKLMNGIIDSIIIASQDSIKSEYRKFLKNENSDK